MATGSTEAVIIGRKLNLKDISLHYTATYYQ